MGILSAPTLTNIKDGFPNQHLTSIVGEPSYTTINKMKRELGSPTIDVRRWLGKPSLMLVRVGADKITMVNKSS